MAGITEGFLEVGFLEVGAGDKGKVVISHPPARKSGRIVLTASQARALAGTLLRFADVADVEGRKAAGPEASQSEKLLGLGRMVWGMVSDVHTRFQLGGAAAAYGIRPISFPGGEVDLIVATKQATAFFEEAARSRFNVLDSAPVPGEVH
jgi:hypothetical protein